MKKLLLIMAVLLILPQIAVASYMCAGNNQIFSNSTTCRTTCTQKMSCTTGAFTVTGNSIQAGNSFTRIVWGQETIVNPVNPTYPGTHNSWIDFQVANSNIVGNITGNITTVTSGTSGGKLTWAQKTDSRNIIAFGTAPAPAQPNEITNNFRPIIGVSITGTNTLNFLAVNLTTNTPEIIGSVPITGGTISELVDGTVYDSVSKKYVEVSRVGTDASNRSIMFFGRNFQGSEITIGLVTIIPSGTLYCPVSFDSNGNPATYSCDANNQCEYPSVCNQVVGTTGSNPFMCGFDLNGDGNIDQSEYSQCKASLLGVSGAIGGFTAAQACEVGVLNCDITCPNGYGYVNARDRCESTVRCPFSSSYNPTTKSCEYSATTTLTCPTGTVLSGTNCVATTTQPAIAIYSCPVGTTLSGTSCVVPSYPAVLVGGIYSCPTGGILSGTTCNFTPFSATASYSCNAGDTLSGTTCTRILTTTYSAFCNSGDSRYLTLTGSRVCKHYTGTRSVSLCSSIKTDTCYYFSGQYCRSAFGGACTPKSFCAVGEDLTADGVCSTFTTYPIYCNAGDTLSGTTCTSGSVPAVTPVSVCPLGGTLTGTTCSITPDCPTCPIGSILSGGVCVADTNIPATAIYTCPMGVLNGLNCDTTTTTDVILQSTCPAGGVLKGTNCVITAEYNGTAINSCPVGTTLSGSQCLTPSYDATKTYICLNGDSLSGTTCTSTITSTYPGTPFCNAGDSLSGTICTHKTTSISTYPASVVGNSCTTGTLNGSKCETTYPASVSGHSCSSGTLNGSNCETTYPASVTGNSCPVGTTLSGGSCLSTYSASSTNSTTTYTAVCNSGDTPSGINCKHLTGTRSVSSCSSIKTDTCYYFSAGQYCRSAMGGACTPKTFCVAGETLTADGVCSTLTTYFAYCNDGDTLSGTTCTHSTTNYYCNGSDTLSGTTCTNSTAPTLPVYTCTAGDVLSGTTCTHTTTATSIYACTAGDVLSGTTCTHTTTATSIYACTVGDVLSGTTCTKTIVTSTTYGAFFTCTSGDSLSGSTCTHLTGTTYMATVSSNCPNGGTLNGTKCDIAPINAFTTYTCPSGGILVASKCTTETIYTATQNYTCSTGILTGMQCVEVVTTPAQVTYSCSTGTLVGTKCDTSALFATPVSPTTATFDPLNMVCITARALGCPGSPSSRCFDTQQTYPQPCNPGDIAIDSEYCGRSTPGNENWQCSPYSCQDMSLPGATITTDPPPTTTDPNGTKDANGQCLDKIEIFSGVGQRCRKPGLATGGMDCCDKSLAPADTTQNGMISTYGGAAAAAIMLLASTGIGLILVIIAIIMSMLMKCNSDDLATVKKLAKGKCHYVGDYCVQKWPLVGCVQNAKGHCCFDSMLSRIVQEQGRPMISTFNPNSVQMTDPLTTGVAPNAHYRGTNQNTPSQGWLPNGGEPSPTNLVCRGFSIDEFTLIDFGNIDLTEWVDDMTAKLATTILKNTQTTQSDVHTRVSNSLQGVKPGGQ
jgi:conjugal transfer mating pair stabilization protein TraN